MSRMINVASLHDADYHLSEVTQDPSAYYLRKGEAPGRWRGEGARALGLQGEVVPQALRDLFEGKHPATGEYLISARGSAARASARDRERWHDVAAVAAQLNLAEAKARQQLRRGTLAGQKTPSGAWRVSSDAVAAFREGKPQPAGKGLPQPAADGTYGLADVAALVGIDRSYLRRLLTSEAPAETTKDDGTAVQYLVGTKDDTGNWRVQREEVERFIVQRRKPKAVPAYDLAVRAPKSVSLLHAMAELLDPDTVAELGLHSGRHVATQILAAHHAALDDTITFLERHAGWVRGPGGRLQATGVTVAAFDHRSSRTGDPLLHSHLVIINAATGLDGRRAALDATALYAWARTAGHVYQARLRSELVARLGVEFEVPHNGTADLVGVPRPVIDAFSERSRQRAELMARLGTSGAKAAQAATLATRPAKNSADHGRSPAEIAAQATALGFGPEQLAQVLGRRHRRVELSAQRVAQVAEDLAGPDGLCGRSTRVDLRDAICGFAAALPEGARAQDLELWATRLLNDTTRFVPVAGGRGRRGEVIRRMDGVTVTAAGVERTVTTHELLAHEARLVALHDDGLRPDGCGIGLGLADPQALADALAARPGLRGEQVQMVRRITTSGVGIEVVVGGPGTGKTYALGVAAEAWRRSGLRLVGASLQGGAAEVLAVEAGLDDQHTLTGLLRRCDNHGAGFLGDSVVILDEAGMADTRQLSRLALYASAAGAKLVLVGDPDQIPEVGAGGAFRHLVERLGPKVVALVENHRQVHHGDRDRLRLIASGRAAEAIDSAKADGRWRGGDTADEVRERLLLDWHTDTGTIAQDKLLVATTVAEVERLNDAARALLVADGRLGPEALTVELAAPDRAVDTRHIAVGDRVRATRNLWESGIFTGRVGTVMAVDAECFEVTVELDRMRDSEGQWRPRQVVTVGREFLCERAVPTWWSGPQIQAPGLTHAYASTAHAVQGRTSARAYVLVAEAGLYRQAAYVAASRARLETFLYGLTVPDDHDLERHERPGTTPEPDPADTAALAEAMAKDASQTMASVDDPLAAPTAELLSRPAAWLWADRAELVAALGGEHPPLIEARRQVRTRLHAAYGLALESLECRQLDDAMTRALAVPGATPERLAELMVGRGHDETRELGSAEDPMAVLVWAAGEYAVEVLTQEHAENAFAADAAANEDGRTTAVEHRLGVVDATLARQRQARLALVETEPGGFVSCILGSAPAQPAGLRAWRRGAAAILDYRDAAGLFDRDGRHPDPWLRALGPDPQDPRLADHRRQVTQVVVECRTAILLAEVMRFVPCLGQHRPQPDLAALAERRLPDLDAELARVCAGEEARQRFARLLHSAREDLARARTAAASAEADLARICGRGGHRSGRRWPGHGRPELPAVVAEARVFEAHRSIEAVAARLARVKVLVQDSLDSEGAPRRLLEEAIALRERRLAAEVLTAPPAWLRADVAKRAATLQATEAARLAVLYGRVAAQAERRGTEDAHDVQAVLGSAPDNSLDGSKWLVLRSELNTSLDELGTGGLEVAL
ncbi:MAG: relaxase domain-containing protein [Actinobacteria bacterium]|nr:relaxase domain-containing protein [Actinomycetota bacterium]